MRSEELTVAGAIHDVCSAIHPLAVGSPAFREIATLDSLADHGLEWVHPDVPLVHPLDGGRAAVLAPIGRRDGRRARGRRRGVSSACSVRS